VGFEPNPAIVGQVEVLLLLTSAAF